MGRIYKRISYSDREMLENLFKSEITMTEIAKIIGVSRATLYLEKKRGWNDVTNQYYADLAQKNFGTATKTTY